MSYKNRDDYRDAEIRLLYYAVYKKNIKDNLSEKEARAAAFDAVSLRFNISQSRARIIISEEAKKPSHVNIAMLIAQNEELIEILKYANEIYRRHI